MRFKPVASTGVTRRSKQPLRLGGYDVPAGAILMVPFDAVHRCNFERPDDFWPVRACRGRVQAHLRCLCAAMHMCK
jgi:cytochrome P450